MTAVDGKQIRCTHIELGNRLQRRRMADATLNASNTKTR